MWLRSLSADRLRNLRAVHLPLDAGLTILTGRNGQGKTSVLEAAYLLGTGHSFRTRRLEEVVARDGGPLRVAGEVARITGEERLGVVVDSGARRLLVADAERELDEYLGRLDLVALPTDASRLLRDAPGGRRRFLDSGIAGLRSGFLRVIGEYRRALAERNALLRRSEAGRVRDGEHDAWEERLAEASARLHRERREYASAVASHLGEVERALCPDGRSFSMGYRPSPAEVADADPESVKDLFLERLRRDRRRDAALGYTASGPHRDELRVDIDGEDLRRYGSAGQVRSAMVALCVAKLVVLKERRGESPLFLMDDFDSDLDEPRGAALAEFLQAGRFQAILATAKEAFAERLPVNAAKIRIEAGRGFPGAT